MTDERNTTTVGLLLDELGLLDPQDGAPAIIVAPSIVEIRISTSFGVLAMS